MLYWIILITKSLMDQAMSGVPDHLGQPDKPRHRQKQPRVRHQFWIGFVCQWSHHIHSNIYYIHAYRLHIHITVCIIFCTVTRCLTWNSPRESERASRSYLSTEYKDVLAMDGGMHDVTPLWICFTRQM